MVEQEEECLKQLKIIIKDSNLPKINKLDDDDYLLRFIRGRKFNTKNAFETLEYNIHVRLLKYPEIFSNLRPSLIKHVLDSGMMGILKHRDQHGRKICYFRACKWNVAEVSADEVMKACVILAEELAVSETTQLNGIILICDYKGFTWAHARHYSLHQMKQFINIFLYSYPTRFGSGYMLNAPSLWQMAYTLLKPFLPNKIKQRVHMSSGDMFEVLHEQISKTILPNWLGGDLNEFDAQDNQLLINPFDKEDFYAQFNK